MTAPTFDRRVSKRFADALAPGGPMHELVELVDSELGLAKGLDVRLRARPGHTGARATLYLGLTQVLHVHHVGTERFKLQVQAGKGVREKLDPTLFDPSWGRPQTLEQLSGSWAAVMTYVRAAVAAAPSRYLKSEGFLQARLGRGNEHFACIDREVVMNFPSQGVKEAVLTREAGAILEAGEHLAGNHRWAEKGKRFGDELDLLGVDREGRVLVVEVKHGGDTAGVGWAPAQVALYVRICRLWVDATPWAPSILNGMLVQATQVGLAESLGYRVREPIELVPVIAVSRPLRNPKAANERMKQVHAALIAQDVELPHLEVWAIEENGAVEHATLGGL